MIYAYSIKQTMYSAKKMLTALITSLTKPDLTNILPVLLQRTLSHIPTIYPDVTIPFTRSTLICMIFLILKAEI